jgi:hypothetical protein
MSTRRVSSGRSVHGAWPARSRTILAEAVADTHARDVGDGGAVVLMPGGVADREFGAPGVPGNRPLAKAEGRPDLIQVVDRLHDRERAVAG